MPKIFVSTYPFGTGESNARRLLDETGWDIVYNPFARKLSEEELLELGRNVDGLIAGTEPLSGFIRQNSKLKIISRVGIGLDSVPLELCRSKQIRVTYTPDAVTPAVAEFTIGLMLAAIRYIHTADNEIRTGGWSRPVGLRLGKSCIGIIGFGRVGKRVVELLAPFRPLRILTNDVRDIKQEILEFRARGINLEFASKESIYSNCDIISLHVPLNPQTRSLIGAEELGHMRPNTFLINTSRGGIVQEEALFRTLSDGLIAGAALDVFNQEPYSGELIRLKNVLLTQHMGSCSFDCRKEMEEQATRDLIRFFRGIPLESPVPDNAYTLDAN